MCKQDVKSEKKYEPEDVLIFYGKEYKSRMVNDREFCSYKNKRFFTGNPFAGFSIGIREFKSNTKVWFDDFPIGTADKITGLIIYEEKIIKVQKKE